MIAVSGQFEKPKIRSYQIFPNSVGKRRFDLWIIVLVIYNVIFTPMEIGMSFSSLLPDWWAYWDYFCDLCFGTDLILNFLTVLVDEFGNVDSKPSHIASKYASGWFPIDIVSTIPFDLFWEALSIFIYHYSVN